MLIVRRDDHAESKYHSTEEVELNIKLTKFTILIKGGLSSRTILKICHCVKLSETNGRIQS